MVHNLICQYLQVSDEELAKDVVVRYCEHCSSNVWILMSTEVLMFTPWSFAYSCQWASGSAGWVRICSLPWEALWKIWKEHKGTEHSVGGKNWSYWGMLRIYTL